MLSSTFPYPPTRGGTEVRTFHLLRWLAQRHEVTLLTQRMNATGSEVLAEGAETRTSADADLAALEALGARVLCFPLGRFAKQSLREWPQGNFPGGSFRNSLGKLMQLGRSHLWGISAERGLSP
ncbi:hypothetical protein O77CONTIG1_00625 [Leptolyngbya sp. O-77]|nr:hypothetical protein O77CONTIG1_00625 [Leptolyngbya sp. O-77]